MNNISESRNTSSTRSSNSSFFERFTAKFSNKQNNSERGQSTGRRDSAGGGNGSASERLRPTIPIVVSRNETIDAGPGAAEPGIAVSLSGQGTNPSASLLNQGAIVGRGQAPAADVTAGDGVRFEGPRPADGGFEPATLSANVVNRGSISSESAVGPTAGLRFVDGVSVQGNARPPASVPLMALVYKAMSSTRGAARFLAPITASTLARAITPAVVSSTQARSLRTVAA